MKKHTIVLIKIGGRSITHISSLFHDMALMNNHTWILVHGGGNRINAISHQYGIQPHFINGIRQTSNKEMDIIDMGLAGLTNTYILRKAFVQGLHAVGLSGVDDGLFIAEKLSQENHTGKIISVNTTILTILMEANYIPIISSVSMNIKGEGININADDAALALAKKIRPHKLIFISDTKGVLNAENAQGQRNSIPHLNEELTQELIQNGTIRNGMIPKVQNALYALKNGSKEVIIGSVTHYGDLQKLMHHKTGTSFIH